MNSKITLLLLAVLLLAGALFPTASVAADDITDDVTATATITVNTATDEDADNAFCSLREAITAANTDSAYKGCSAGSGHDNITFAAGLTITVGSQLPVVSSTMTITGNGTGDTIIQASACDPAIGVCSSTNHRIFRVTGNLTLNQVTVRHGRCVGACDTNPSEGGAILNGGSLSIWNSSILGNRATSGGAIYNTNTSSLSVLNSTIAGNYAQSGGAIYNAGSPNTFFLVGTVLSGNHADISGGAIYNYAGTFSISRTYITANYAGLYGAGMYNNAASYDLNQSAFAGNSADPYGDGHGGGIYNHNNSTATIRNTTFVGNHAFNGGAMFNHSSAPSLTNVTFSGNSAQSFGGGIYNQNSNYLLTLKNAIVWNNSAVTGGAEIYNSNSNPTINFSVIKGGCPAGSNCTSILNADPMLGGFEYNGGNIPIMALEFGSSAIDSGTDNGCPSSDGRNVARPKGVRCDIGAYESDTMIAVKSNGAQDGWVLESDENSGAGGTMNSKSTTLLVGDDAANRQYRAILSFDTSTLPDTAIVTQVMLKVKRAGVSGTSPFGTHINLMVDVRKGPFANNAALQIGDFKAGASKSNVGSIPKTLTDGWFVKTWTSGILEHINKTGVTQLRLRFKLDDNNDFGADVIKLSSGNTSAASRPQLFIEYTP